jgi:hypothetical protein
MGYMAKVVEIVTKPSPTNPKYREVVKVLQERPREPGEDDVDDDEPVAMKADWTDDDTLPF